MRLEHRVEELLAHRETVLAAQEKAISEEQYIEADEMEKQLVYLNEEVG